MNEGKRHVQDLATLPLLDNGSVTGNLFGNQGRNVGLEHSGTDTHDDKSDGKETDNSPESNSSGRCDDERVLNA